jgi:hypothetical protein
MTYEILKKEEWHLYFEHIDKNYKNTREYDDLLLDKIISGLENDNRAIVFVEKNDKGEIVTSIMTKKRVVYNEYIIVNYRTTGNNFFNKKKFMGLFNFVFQHYENIKYYRWLAVRPINLLPPKFFKGVKESVPFNRYLTAIEYAPAIEEHTSSFYETELFSGIPETLDKKNFFVISGFCKQEFRTQMHVLGHHTVSWN